MEATVSLHHTEAAHGFAERDTEARLHCYTGQTCRVERCGARRQRRQQQQQQQQEQQQQQQQQQHLTTSVASVVSVVIDRAHGPFRH